MLVKFREKAQQEEDDYQEVLAIQREQEQAFGGRSTTRINPGPAVPMSPPRSRPTPRFMSTSASTLMPSSSFGASRFGASRFGASRFGASLNGASTIRATIPFPCPTLSNVQTRFTRFGPQARPSAITTRVRPHTTSDLQPLESLASLFPIRTPTPINHPSSPTPPPSPSRN